MNTPSQLEIMRETYESWRQHPMTTIVLKMLDARREKYVKDSIVASISYHLPAEAVRGAVHCVHTIDAIKTILTDFDTLSNLVNNKTN